MWVLASKMIITIEQAHLTFMKNVKTKMERTKNKIKITVANK